MKRKTDIPLFLFGLFSMTQISVIGSIGISELVCFLVAPFLFAANYGRLKSTGFIIVPRLALLACTGCALSSFHNATVFPLFIRGMASTYSLFATPVVLFALLHENLRGIKWIFVGVACSLIVNVFVFQTGYELSGYAGGEVSSDTATNIMHGTLFWLQRITSWLMVPVYGWYLSTPTPYSAVAPIVMSIHTLMTTESGRSATMTAVGAVALILLGRKKIRSMLWVQRHLVLLAILGGVVLFTMKSVYVYLGEERLLNEKAMRKYENQSKQGTGFLKLLIGGRAGFFAGLRACCDNPFWGFGPWARDEKEYYKEFLAKYGDAEDYDRFTMEYEKHRARGGVAGLMPAHSHIVGFWVNYGLLGLPFWVYIFCCMIRHFRKNMAAIPQWYGYFAYYLPLNLWHIFFSPYGNRIEDCVFVTCLMLADAVRRQKIPLSDDMGAEAIAHM